MIVGNALQQTPEPKLPVTNVEPKNARAAFSGLPLLLPLPAAVSRPERSQWHP